MKGHDNVLVPPQVPDPFWEQGIQPVRDEAATPQVSQKDRAGASYSEGGQVPNVVTTEVCTAERVPDPRYNDIVDLKPARDHRSQTGDQSVLPPTNTFPKVGHRDRKSRSASFSKHSNVSQARTASFARSVSPTISKLQTGSA